MRPVRTCFRCGFSAERIILARYEQLVGSLSKRHAVIPSDCKQSFRTPTVCKRTVSGTISPSCEEYFSPFPHGTCSLSVTDEYLALRDGSRRFPQNSTYSVVLGILLRSQHCFRLRGIHALWPAVPGPSANRLVCNSPAYSKSA